MANDHLSTKPQLATFFVERSYLINLIVHFYDIKIFVYANFGTIAVFYCDLKVFTVFYFSKKVNFWPQILAFLVVGYLKKMNPRSSGLSYVQTNLQK